MQTTRNHTRAFTRSALVAALFAAGMSLASAQTFSPTVGDNSSLDQQVIGDTTSTADHTQSTSTQLGNSANNNGASMSNNVDTRDQNTVNSAGGSATGGSAHGNLSDNDNRSSVGNTSSNSGGNNLSNGGNTTGGNTMVGGSTGGNTLSNGSSSGGNTMVGGANTAKGGEGGSASSTGTNLGINGQQQGIDRSGNSANANDNKNSLTGANSDNKNTNTAAQGQGQGQGQGQQQANNGTNAQGQTSANRNSQNTSAGNGAGASAGAGAGAGAGSGNRTANTTRVDASDKSTTTYTSKAVVLPPILHGAAAAPLATATMTVVPGICGPRHEYRKTAVVGRQHGLLWGYDEVPQGDDYELVPSEQAFIQRDGWVEGAIVNEFVAVVGVSSAKSLSAMGYGKEQQGGGAGMSNGGSHQRIVVRASIRACAMPLKEQPPIVVPPARVELPTVPSVRE